MSLKDISYLELWQPLCLVERKHLCNFGRLAPVLKTIFHQCVISYTCSQSTLMALFKDWFNWHYNKQGGASLHPSIPDLIDTYLF